MLSESKWLQRGLAKRALYEQARLRSLRSDDTRLANTHLRNYRLAIGRLERLKRSTQPLVVRALQRLTRLMGITVPRQAVFMIEEKINREGWMQKIIQKRFATESAHGGAGRWRRLQDSTARFRKRHGFGKWHPINVQTGTLKEAAIRYVQGTFRAHGKLNWDAADIGVEYAEYVEDKRPFMQEPSSQELAPVMRRARDLARKYAADYYRRQLHGQGGGATE